MVCITYSEEVFEEKMNFQQIFFKYQVASKKLESVMICFVFQFLNAVLAQKSGLDINVTVTSFRKKKNLGKRAEISVLLRIPVFFISKLEMKWHVLHSCFLHSFLPINMCCPDKLSTLIKVSWKQTMMVSEILSYTL